MLSLAGEDVDEIINGTILSILFQHKDSYTLKFKTKSDVQFTVLIDYGQVYGPRLLQGEVLTIEGSFEHSVTYGDQLISKTVKRTSVNEAQLIIPWITHNKYIEGVGVQTRKKLLNSFGGELAEVLNHRDIDTICDDSEISATKILAVISAWKLYKKEISAIRYLTNKKFPYGLAINCMSAWGEKSGKFIDKNPYNLGSFLPFYKLDKFISERWSIDKSDPRRVLACAEAILTDKYHRTGDTADTKKNVFSKMKQRLGFEIKNLPTNQSDILEIEGDLLQAAGPCVMERFVESRLNEIFNHGVASKKHFNKDIFTAYSNKVNFTLNKKQIDAIQCAVDNPISLIIGAANSGKSTVLEALILQLTSNKTDLVLLAPTFNAAVRVSEATNSPAKTICSFISDLKRINGKESYHKIAIIVNEASIIDLPTIYCLLTYLPSDISLILVGDDRQLPPAGAGLFFHKLVSQIWIPKVRLIEAPKQYGELGIRTITNAILNYQVPDFPPVRKLLKTGCVFRNELDENKNISNAAKLYQMINTNLLNIEHRNLQIIAGTKAVVQKINIAVQKLVNPIHEDNNDKKIRVSEDYFFTVQDKIIFNKNDYKRGLTIGSIGTVIDVYPKGQLIAEDGVALKVVLRLRFDDLKNNEKFEGENDVYLTQEEFFEESVSLSYAVTAPKSQGSQYDSVIIVLDSIRLSNNAWIYSAITRTRNSCYIMGNKQLLYKSITTLSQASNRIIGVKYEQI